MTDRALRYFLAVARTGSIRGAAEVLHVAASAISRQILELEAECGQALLERLPRGVVLTEAGRVVADHAQRQADELSLLEDRLRRLQGARQGTVRLCCGAGFLADLLDHGLAGFSTAHPGIAFHVTTATSDGILAALAQGEADIGLAYTPPAQAGLRSVLSIDQPLQAVLPPRHPLALAGLPVPLRSFASEPVALLPPDHGIRQLIARVEADADFRLVPRLETASFELHRRFVAAGMGFAFLPGFTVTAELRAGSVAAVPLRDPLLSEARAHLLVRAGRRMPEAAGRLIDWLAAHMVAFRAMG
ncbi:LysR family transcriptional regulator [Roseicella aquatilis]|uniref:LysR family transcriptional regulator n=1 Tax=Roseicella aquatilis TaxID=2527868 RepID=A0A4R4DW93_9PROT|nr:LysR substrate-binding domain-containing protein [Roseicella aquatilis]TCZ64938.1 LysR family transcriptional regulator [Roseicella aquatilis]